MSDKDTSTKADSDCPKTKAPKRRRRVFGPTRKSNVKKLVNPFPKQNNEKKDKKNQIVEAIPKLKFEQLLSKFTAEKEQLNASRAIPYMKSNSISDKISQLISKNNPNPANDNKTPSDDPCNKRSSLNSDLIKIFEGKGKNDEDDSEWEEISDLTESEEEKNEAENKELES